MIDYTFINIVGIDGSGKTTLCENLSRELNNNHDNFRYVHSYHEPLLLKPFKALARFIFMRGIDEFGDYAHYRQQKASTSNIYRKLVHFYVLIWIIDYILQVLYRICIPKLTKTRLLADRYIYDAILNVSLTANLSHETLYRIIDMLFMILPKPDIVFIIDLPEEVAFKRKNDIQSMEYLKERRRLYLEMSDRYGFIIINGQDTPQDILVQVMLRLT